MSSIDNRVVEMEFDNAQFESEAKRTMGTLGKLKKDLEFKDAGKGIEEIGTATKKLSFGGLVDGVKNASKSFPALAIVGATALGKLTMSAIDAGVSMGQALIGPLVEGGKRRALAIEQAKFQFQGLKMDVEETMAAALYAVKGTAFGLDEAATAAASLGASQVPIANMGYTLRAVSGVAALSGSSFSSIADVFTKVAGQGRLMGDDLNRLAARGVNAAAVLAEAMGKTEAEVRSMVSKGQIDFDTFAKAMDDAFGEHATKASETYTGALSNMRAALSRIGASFATTDFEAKRIQLNALTRVVDDFAEALEPVIKFMGDLAMEGARVNVALMEGLDFKDLGLGLQYIVLALRNLKGFADGILAPIGQAFAEAFPPSASTLISDLGRSLYIFTSKFVVHGPMYDAIKAKALGFFNGVKAAAAVFGSVMQTVGSILMVIFAGLRVAFAAIGAVLAPVGTAISTVIGHFQKLTSSGKNIDKTTSILEKFLSALEGFRTGGLAAAAAYLNDMASSVGKWGAQLKTTIANSKILAGIGEKIADIWKKITGVFDGLGSGGNPDVKGDGFQKFIDTVSKMIEGLKEKAKAFGKVLSDTFGHIPNIISNAFRGFNPTTLAGIFTGVTFVGIIKQLKELKGLITGGFEGISDVGTSFKEVFESITGTLEAMQAKLKAEALIKIAGAIGILALSLALLAFIDPARLLSAGAALGVVAAYLVGALAAIDKLAMDSGELMKVSGALVAFSMSMLIMSAAFKAFDSISWEGLLKGLIAFASVVAATIIMSKLIESNAKGLISASISIHLIAGAMIALAGAVALFSLISWEGLAKGGASIAVLLLLLAGFTHIVNPQNLILTGLGLQAVAFAIIMMSGAVAIFGSMDLAALAQGMGALAVTLGLLIVAVNLMTGGLAGAAAAVVIAAALLLLTVPIRILGEMPFETVGQGIGAMALALSVLALAATLMVGALPGAAAILVLSISVMVLAGALAALAAIGPEGIVLSLLSLVGALIVLGGASAILAPLLPVMAGLAGALLLFGIATIAAGAGAMALAVGLGMLAPVAGPGAIALLQLSAAGLAVALMSPLLVVAGVGLAAFGLGLLIAAPGLAIFGSGLLMLGLGLGAVGANAATGAAGMEAVAAGAGKLLIHIPGLLAMGAAFLAFGAGALAAGAGSLALAVGAIALSMGLVALAAGAKAAEIVLGDIQNRIVSLAGTAGSMNTIASSFDTLGSATLKLNSSMRSASSGLSSTASGLIRVSQAAAQAINVILMLPAAMSSATAQIIGSLTSMSGALTTSVSTVGSSMLTMKSAVDSGSQGVAQAFVKMGGDVTTGGTRVVAAVRSMSTQVSSAMTAMASSVGASAQRVGTAIIDGMVRGLSNSGRVTAAARSVAQKALNAANNALGIRSPSKEFEKIGKYVNEGFTKGLRGNEDQITRAFDDLRERIREGMSTADEEIAKHRATIAEIEKKAARNRTAAEKKRLEEARQQLKIAEELRWRTYQAHDMVQAAMEKEQKQLVKLRNKYEDVTESLKAAQSVLDDAIKKRDDAQKGWTEQYGKLGDMKLDEDRSLTNYMDDLQKQYENTVAYNKDLQKLREMGIDDEVYKQLLDMGLDGHEFVKQLLEGGWGAVENLNNLNKKLDEESEDLGKKAAKTLYQAGVDAAQGIVDGLAEKEEALRAEMEKLATYLVDEFKWKLGIKSPSRVFKKLGSSTIEGAILGIKSMSTGLSSAASDAGGDAADAMRLTLSDIWGALDGDLGDPVITPILDLSELEKGARMIGDILSPETIGTRGQGYGRLRSLLDADSDRRKPGDDGPEGSSGTMINYTQYNNSPKALSSSDIYRRTKNQLSTMKEALPR